MSKHHPDQPADESRLPHELMRYESMLARIALPPSQLNRDELLYRAGWAAGENCVRLSLAGTTDQPRMTRAVSRQSAFAWSLASATIAASLAVVLTLNFYVRDDPARRYESGIAAVPQGTHETDAQDEPRQAILHTEQRPTRKTTLRSPRDWSSPLLIMRDQALLQRWDDPWAVAERTYATATPGNFSAQQTTSRELMRELLSGSSHIGS